jgi:Cysteine-rich secretory protein family
MFGFLKSTQSATGKGGKYIAFDPRKGSFLRPSTCKKRSWRNCGSYTNVKRVVDSLDSEDCSESEGVGNSATTSYCSMRSVTSVSTRNVASEDISSSFGMLNQTRSRWNSTLRPLQRCPELDALAEKQANAMAASNSISHHNPSDLCSAIKIKPSRRLGENVIAGKDLLDMHVKMVGNVTNYANIVDSHYDSVGVASARSSNGKYYLCILFRG